MQGLGTGAKLGLREAGAAMVDSGLWQSRGRLLGTVPPDQDCSRCCHRPWPLYGVCMVRQRSDRAARRCPPARRARCGRAGVSRRRRCSRSLAPWRAADPWSVLALGASACIRVDLWLTFLACLLRAARGHWVDAGAAGGMARGEQVADYAALIRPTEIGRYGVAATPAARPGACIEQASTPPDPSCWKSPPRHRTPRHSRLHRRRRPSTTCRSARFSRR